MKRHMCHGRNMIFSSSLDDWWIHSGLLGYLTIKCMFCSATFLLGRNQPAQGASQCSKVLNSDERQFDLDSIVPLR